MKEELKLLWKNTFGDPSSYLDFFFTHIFKEENVLCYKRGDKIIAALHIIPYSMNYNGKVVPVSYICGVATVPEERGKGLMYSLMQKAHQLSKERGDVCTVLIPASPELFIYYRKMGYCDFFFYESYEYNGNETNMDINDYFLSMKNEFSIQELYTFFDTGLRKRKICILHTSEDFFHIIEELELAGGYLKVLATKNKQIAGMAFIFPDPENESQLLIKEMVCIDEKSKEILLAKIAGTIEGNQLIVREPVQKGKAIPFGMAYFMNDSDVRPEYMNIGVMSLMLE